MRETAARRPAFSHHRQFRRDLKNCGDVLGGQHRADGPAVVYSAVFDEQRAVCVALGQMQVMDDNDHDPAFFRG